MVAIAGLLAFVAMFAAIYLVGRWILGPIDRAAKEFAAPARISLGDFLCLFFVVQLPLTFASRLRTVDETEIYFWLFTILAWVVAPIIWISCARTLSRAGITNGNRRLVFIGLVLPIVFYGLTPFAVLALLGGLHFCFGDQLELIRDWWWLMLGWVLMGFALVACGRYTNWLVLQNNPAAIPSSIGDESADVESHWLDDPSSRQ